MAEDVARAVGAEGANVIMIAGKECRPRPLTIKELTELERECLQSYKREYIATFAKNLDLFPSDLGEKMLNEKIDAAAKWTVSDLPLRWSYDPSFVQVTDKIVDYLKSDLDYRDEEYPSELRIIQQKKLIAAALDSGHLSPTDYESRVGTKPRKSSVSYVGWWITGTIEGMISMIWLSFRGAVTKDQIMKEIGNNYSKMAMLARDIETLTVPDSGNG